MSFGSFGGWASNQLLGLLGVGGVWVVKASMKACVLRRARGHGVRSRLRSGRRGAWYSLVGFYVVSGTWGGNFSRDRGSQSVISHRGEWVALSSVEGQTAS